MKFLVIPDVHNKIVGAEQIITAMPDHQPVFLGDYFDSFHDTPDMAEQTAKWLAWSLGQGRIHLMGNHDLPYRWRHQSCPGFSEEKLARVKREMSPFHWNQMGLFKVIRKEGLRPLVLSHAGFTLNNLYGIDSLLDTRSGGRAEHLRKLTTDQHLDMIGHEGRECLKKASYIGDHHWFNQGTRMGELRQGGPFWIDKDYFARPIFGIDQIVGHSWVNKPKVAHWPTKAAPASKVWFMDGGGMFAATVEAEDDGTGGLTVTPIYATGTKIGEPIK